MKITVLTLPSALLLFVGCSEEVGPPARHVRIGYTLTPESWLLALAIFDERLATHGIVAELKLYPSGRRALNGLLDGEVDLAVSAGVPIALASPTRRDLRILSTVGSSNNTMRIVARRNAGIRVPSDLEGKRLSTQRKSASAFFLHLFLGRHGISSADVVVTHHKVEELPSALSRGDVDAISTREPFASQAIDLLAENAVVFDAAGLYFKSFHLVGRSPWVTLHSATVEAVLRALLATEKALSRDVERMARLLAGHLETKPDAVLELLRTLHLRLALSQSLFLSLEEQSRWAIKEGLVAGPDVPDFFGHVDYTGLQRVAPDRVTMVR